MLWSSASTGLSNYHKKRATVHRIAFQWSREIGQDRKRKQLMAGLQDCVPVSARLGLVAQEVSACCVSNLPQVDSQVGSSS